MVFRQKIHISLLIVRPAFPCQEMFIYLPKTIKQLNIQSRFFFNFSYCGIPFSLSCLHMSLWKTTMTLINPRFPDYHIFSDTIFICEYDSST